MNDNPTISVVMSVYNGELYIEEAIKSILSQTYKDFEFIIINDGSADKSLEIIEEYKNQDERVVLISRGNKGLIASLNEGIEKARGEYIARMDADDISLPSRFEEQLKFMESNYDVGVCGTGIVGFGENMKENISFYSVEDSSLKVELLFSSVFAHPSVMMRKDLIKKYNLKYEESYKNAEDFELWVQMAKYTKFANLKKPLLRYRVLQDSITRKSDIDIENRYRVIKSIFERYLQKLGINNSEEENKLHFNLTVNNRIKNSNIKFEILDKYFKKIEFSNTKKKVFEASELKKVLGKKWLWNLYYTKNIKGLLSRYFIYGIWSIITK